MFRKIHYFVIIFSAVFSLNLNLAVSNDGLILTFNGIDIAKQPLEVEGKDNLIISVKGEDADASYSVEAQTGYVEPYEDSNQTVEGVLESFKFSFVEEGVSVGSVNLYIDDDLVYQIAFFYNPQANTTIAFGSDYDALHEQTDMEKSVQNIGQTITVTENINSLNKRLYEPLSLSNFSNLEQNQELLSQYLENFNKGEGYIEKLERDRERHKICAPPEANNLAKMSNNPEIPFIMAIYHFSQMQETNY